MSGGNARADVGLGVRSAGSSGGLAPLGLAIALAALTLTAFLGVAELDYVAIDDPGYVSANPVVLRGLGLEGLRYAFTSTELGNWHPLTWLSHMLIAQLAGGAASAHHLANLALHVLSVVLLFAMLLRSTGAAVPSALAAGLFAVHPLRVESVAWVSERKDVLSMAFWMLALHAWVSWARTQRRRWYLATAAAFLAGLMSKPMLVTLPFTLLLLDVWPLRRWRKVPGGEAGLSLRRLVLEKLPLFALSVAWCGVAIFAQRVEGGMEFGETIPFAVRAANAMRTVGVYLLQTVWPVQLAVWYPYPDPVPILDVLLSALAAAAISVAAVRAFTRAPYLLVGWLWYLGTLVPVLGLVQVGNQAHHDHYTYVPHVGLLSAVAFGAAALARGAPWRRLVTGVVAVAALAGCALATVEMVEVWRDNKSLFANAIEATQGSTLGHDHMAHALQEEGRIDEAILHYREVVRIEPEMATAHVNLGTALEQKGDIEGAIACYERALELDPANANASSNIGAILARSGRNAEAAPFFRRAVELAPEKPGLVGNLALNELLLGRRAEAAEHFRRAVELDPAVAEGPQAGRFAWVLATYPEADARDGALALRIAERLAGLRRDAATLELLAAAQAECGRFEQAARTAQEALRSARAADQLELAARLEQAVALFGSGQPLRVP